jgi:hypothetical protein
MIYYFSVHYHGENAWNINSGKDTLFSIRQNEQGTFYLQDCQPGHCSTLHLVPFPTLDAAMAWVCGALMKRQDINRKVSPQSSPEEPQISAGFCRNCGVQRYLTHLDNNGVIGSICPKCGDKEPV